MDNIRKIEIWCLFFLVVDAIWMRLKYIE
jgi:hypothetical protein